MENQLNAGKCQCISFNKNGIITESDNALFNTGFLAGHPIAGEVPFIKKIYSRLLKLKATDQPLFFPHVRLDLDGYSGICDFFFTRVRQYAEEGFVWFIYDNSLHYGQPKNSGSQGPGCRG